MENAEDVFRARSPYQRIDIVHDESGYPMDIVMDAYSRKFTRNPEQPRGYVLFLNGDFQLTSSYEEYYHEFFAHVPIAMHRSSPRQVLVMGAGDGLLIRELIKYPDIDLRLYPGIIQRALVHAQQDRMVLREVDPRLFGHADQMLPSAV